MVSQQASQYLHNSLIPICQKTSNRKLIMITKKIDISLACFGKTKGKKTKKLAELRVFWFCFTCCFI